MPKQTTDVSAATYGIIYSGPGETWSVAKGGTVEGDSGAVLSTYASSTLVNGGLLTSDGYGLYFAFDGGPVEIANSKAGVIDAYRAVYLSGTELDLTFRNAGLIEGSEFAVSVLGGVSGTFTNKGAITADLVAVELHLYAGSDGITFQNSGRIVGGQTGLVVAGRDISTMKVVNTEDGVIKGGDIGVGVAERLVLKNLGKIGGMVVSGNHDDKVINKNKIKGDVWLGDGADHFVNKNKAKAGLVDAGEGFNVVVMGFRADKVLFDSPLAEGSNRTTVKNFESGEDKLFLDETFFTALTPGPLLESEFRKGAAAEDADDHIIYDQKSGMLYYDPDGAGGAGQIGFGKLEKGAKLAASDFTVGEFSIVA